MIDHPPTPPAPLPVADDEVYEGKVSPAQTLLYLERVRAGCVLPERFELNEGRGVALLEVVLPEDPCGFIARAQQAQEAPEEMLFAQTAWSIVVPDSVPDAEPAAHLCVITEHPFEGDLRIGLDPRRDLRTVERLAALPAALMRISADGAQITVAPSCPASMGRLAAAAADLVRRRSRRSPGERIRQALGHLGAPR